MIGTRYHTCGTRLTVTWKWNGLNHVLYLLDKDGNEIVTCPGCDEYIYGSEFLLEPPKRKESQKC